MAPTDEGKAINQNGIWYSQQVEIDNPDNPYASDEKEYMVIDCEPSNPKSVWKPYIILPGGKIKMRKGGSGVPLRLSIPKEYSEETPSFGNVKIVL